MTSESDIEENDDSLLTKDDRSMTIRSTSFTKRYLFRLCIIFLIAFMIISAVLFIYVYTNVFVQVKPIKSYLNDLPY